MKLSYMNEQYICQEMNPSIIYLWHFAEERVVQKAANQYFDGEPVSKLLLFFIFSFSHHTAVAQSVHPLVRTP